jgi:AraC-like DNA-binding protein
MEICYFHKGEQVYEVNNKTYCLKGGDVFVTFPNELHSTGNHPEEKGFLYWLVIKMPLVENGFFYYNKKESEPIIDALLNLPVRHFKGNAKMKGTLETILEIADKKENRMQRIMLDNLLISFLIQVIMDAGNTLQIPKQPSANAAKIHTFIMNNFKEELSIKAMANILHLSDSRFKGWFKEEFGIPPLEFILRKRIEEAKILMQTQLALRMNEIANNLGFSSPQYFATVFKRYTSLSPKEYKAAT